MAVPAVRAEKAYEKYSWIIIFALAVLFIIVDLAFQFVHPLLSRPEDYLVLRVFRAWGTSSVGFYLLVLAMSLKSFRRGERWAWYALWFLPVSEISHFAYGGGFNPPPESMTIQHLVFATVFVAALLLPYRKFFPKISANV